MKKLFLPLLALAALATASGAEDLSSPETAGPQSIRVLLHIGTSERLLDYQDVAKVIDCKADQITFETQGGLVVTHRGTFTVIQNRTSFSDHQSRGVRFYDAK